MSERSELTSRTGDRIVIDELSWLPLEFLLFNMSAQDRRDMIGQSPTDNPLAIAWAIMNAEKGIGWMVSINGRPAGALGVFEVHRGTWSIWAIGVDRPDVALLIVGQIFERAIPHIRGHGGHRIQCRTRYDHKANRSHLGLLGFKIEAVLRQFGTDKAHYVQYVFLLDEYDAEQSELAAPSISVPAAQGERSEPALL